MPRGGARPGAGRPSGQPNKRTQAVADAVKQAAATLAEVIPGAFDGDAHAYLMAIYKDPSVPRELRIDAAKAAVRYEKPALSSMTATLTHKPASALDDDDLAQRIARLDEELALRPAGDEEAQERPRKPH